MTPEKYEQLKGKIAELLPAHQWLLEKMLATPKEQTTLEVIFKTPETIYISKNATIGPDTIIDGMVRIRGKSVIGHHCIIDNAHLTDARLGNYIYIGPYAQISNSTIGDGTAVPHHSYIGNTSIGMYCNIGDTTTTSNFDGIQKHQTIIGDRCFIGTHVDFIAPIIIGNEVRIFPKIRVASQNPIPDHAFVIPKIENGRETIDVLENRSFMLIPGKWLLTKKPIEPAHMKEYLTKIRLLFKDPWQALSTPLRIFDGKTHLDLLKFEGEEGLAKLMDELGNLESGGFS